MLELNLEKALDISKIKIVSEIEDILYYNGSIIFAGKNMYNDIVLGLFLDEDNFSIRYLNLILSYNDYLYYLNNQKTLFETINKAKEIYISDISVLGDCYYKVKSFEEIQKDYLFEDFYISKNIF